MSQFKDAINGALNDFESPRGQVVELVLGVINFLACLHYVVDTYAWSEQVDHWLHLTELILVSIFAVEYVLRVWTAKKNAGYIFSFYGVIDLLSIVPVLVSFRGSGFLRAFKVLRILRFVRLLETQHFFWGKVSEIRLQVMRVVFTISMLLFISAGAIHYIEAGPNVENSQIRTFDDALYFSVTTLTTVGFGDMVPVTRGGKWIVVILILSAIILIPWQTGQLVRILLRNSRGKTKVTCPDCGLMYHDRDASHCKACGHLIYQEYVGDE